MKVLVSDKLSELGLAIFKETAGIELDYQPGLGKDIPQLKEAIKDADAIAIRSGTKLTQEILEAAPKLKAIGRAGIGVDNVDVGFATQRGIVVMNTPFGNAITTAEHAISMMCALTRQIPQATISMKAGKWEKSKFMGRELYQKTLGVIGCGNIGRIVISRAQGLQMKVIGFDPFLTQEKATELGIEKVELDELYQKADYITLHVPKNEKTQNMINTDAFAKMKKGVFIINCARGGIVDEAALATAINEGKVAGAALDVFDKEPIDPNHPLLALENVIATPHLGAATNEAQENVAVDVAKQICQYLTSGGIENAVNVASVSEAAMQKVAPYLSLAQKVGLVQGHLADSAPKKIRIDYVGQISKLDCAPLTVAIVQGILAPFLDEQNINPVNALLHARNYGLQIEESKNDFHRNYTDLIRVTLFTEKQTTEVSATLLGKAKPRIVRVDDHYLEAVPKGLVLIIANEDKPGVVGNVGSLLSQKGINISRMQLALSEKTKKALSFYNVEGTAIDNKLLDEIKTIDGVTKATLVDFGN